jgi:hypothetical protein
MNGRSIASFLFSLILVGILVAVGVGIYQAGVAQGVIDAGRFPAGAAVPVAGYGYHDGGFGFLGLLFPLFFLFLIFGVLRAVFGHRRGWGHGYGYGRDWDKGPGPGFGDMPGPRWDRERTIAEMHKRLHEQDSAGGSGAPGSGGPDAPAAR